MLGDTRLKRVLRAIERGMPVPSDRTEAGRLEEALSKVSPWDSEGLSGWESTCLGTFTTAPEEVAEIDQIVTPTQDSHVLRFSEVHIPSTYESDLLHLHLLKNEKSEFYLVVVYDPVDPFADGKLVRKIRLREDPFEQEDLARLLESFSWRSLIPSTPSRGGLCRRIRHVYQVWSARNKSGGVGGVDGDRNWRFRVVVRKK